MKEVGVRIKVGSDGLENITKLGTELEAAGGSAKIFDAEAKRLADELARLGREQGLIDNFKKTKDALKPAEDAMKAAKDAAQQLGRELANTETPTKAQANAFDKARTAARSASDAFLAQRLEVQTLRTKLGEAGISADQLAAAQVRVRQQTQAARDGVATLTTTLRSQVDAYRSTADAAAAAATKQKAAATTALDGVKDVGAQLQRLQSLASVAIGGGIFTSLLKDAATTADEFSNLQARIKLVTGEGPAFVSAFEGIFAVAKRTSSSLEATGTLFARIAQAGKEIGVSQANALKLTETINQAVQLSGASAEASNAAIRQFIQGLQSGVLRGDEFNSVMEGGDRLARALADGLGVSKSALRQMADEGKLTSETIIGALQGQSDAVAKEFEKLPPTVGRALQNLSSEWSKFIGELNNSSGATSLVADGINKLADNLDTVGRIAAEVGAVLVASLAVKGVAALRAYAVEALAATSATGLLSASIAKVPKAINIVVAIAGFELAYQFGTFLYENFELARKLGIGITEFFTNVVSDLQFLKEAAAAVFTDDTVGAAFDRYKTRAADMQQTFAAMYDDAKNAPGAVTGAAEAAAGQMASLAGTATATGATVAAAGVAGGAGVSGIGKQAQTAQDALAALAAGASTSLPAIGVAVEKQAAKLAEMAKKSTELAQALGNELPAAISKLSGAELEKFKSALVGSLQDGINKSVALAGSLKAGSDGARQALAEAEAQGKLLNQVLIDTGIQAAKSLGVDLSAAGKKLSTEFIGANLNLTALIGSMPALSAAGIDAGAAVAQAISKMIDGAKSQAEIDAINTRLKVLGDRGILTGDQVAGAMKQSADKATELKQKLEDATPGIQSLGEAARKAGVDFEQLTTGVSKGFKDGLQDIKNLADEVTKAGVSAETSRPLLEGALDQKIAAAKTKEEIELLRKVIVQMGKDGLLTEQQVGGMLDKLKTKSNEARGAASGVAKAWKDLGVDISKSAELSTADLIRSYETAKQSGTGSAEQLRTAFKKMAESAIRDTKGIVPEWVKVEAAARGCVIEIDEFGKATVRAAKAGENAGDVLDKAFSKLAGSIGDASDKLDVFSAKAIKARKEAELSILGANKYDPKTGMALDSEGKPLIAGGQVNVPEGAVFDQAAFDRAQRSANLSGLKPPNPADYYTQPSAGLRGYTADELAELRKTDPGGFNGSKGYTPFGSYGRQQQAKATAPTPAPAAEPAAATGTQRVAVDITVNGTRIGTGYASSAAEAANWQSLLRQLTEAAVRTGP